MQPFIIMTDYAEVNTAVESMKLGSIDYIPKQLVEDKLALIQLFLSLIITKICSKKSRGKKLLVIHMITQVD